MEATALSVGKAVLDGALGYAKSVVSDEIALQLGVEQDVAFITDELEMMQSFLMTADEEQDKNTVVLTWVKQVREVAYNVEDNLMDFSVHIDKRPSCWWCIPRTLRERRDIAMEVKKLRTRVEDVSNRNLRYRLITGSGSKSITTSIASAAMSDLNEARRTAMEQEKPKVVRASDSLPGSDENSATPNGEIQEEGEEQPKDAGGDKASDSLAGKKFDRRKTMALVDDVLLGRKTEKSMLIELVGKPEDHRGLNVISVWAMGGIGKTTLVRSVYKSQQFGNWKRAWATALRPFNPELLIRRLGTELLGSNEKTTTMKLKELIDKLTEFLKTEKCLIVLDDISSTTEWDLVKSCFENATRIIVTTREKGIAKHCSKEDENVRNLSGLKEDVALDLFKHKVVRAFDSLPGSDKNSAMPNSEIQEEGEEQPKDVGGDKASDSLAGKKFDRMKTMALVDDVLLGRKTEKSKLIELVGKPEDHRGLKVISVWGMGGIGKTTLVRSVYKSHQLGNWKRAWATALRPFNPELLIRRLGTELLGLNKETTTMELKELTDKLTKFLKEEKCLIVLDDISSTTEWDLVKSCFENATRIIVTTREKGIAKHCSKEDKNMWNLSGLKEDVALDLFKNKVFKDDIEEIKLLPDMIEQARFIIKKCDGLPLAISTIGGFLATKPKTASEWRKTYDRISTELEINPELRTIKTVLVRSYDGLPYHLKSCFLYLSIFPEDHKIRRKHVIRQWVAEGYAREIYGMTAEEVGDMYFEELLERSMILPGEDVNIYSVKIDSCQIHDIMRQICISKAREENLSFTLEDSCNLRSTHGALRHLAISSNWRGKEDVFQTSLDLSHVRSLTVVGGWGSFFISKKMRFLRVMDLEGTHKLEDHHLSQIGELIHLKFLSLRHCFPIRHLPNSFGKLSNLQTLDIRGTNVSKLPPNITNLRKLQFLHSGDYTVVRRGIGKLNALCTLANVSARGKGKGIIKEFTQLFQLRKLGVRGITETESEEFWFAIGSLKHLRSLSVNWRMLVSADGMDCSLGGSLLPPRSLESLKLDGRPVRLTEWIHQLQNLSRLQLCRTQLQQDAIQAVGKLPNLAILGMAYGSFKGEELVLEQGYFPSLVRLELRFICDVAFVKFEDGAMPKLELLQIVDWWGLRELSGLKYLTKLKEIRLDLRRSKKFNDNVQDQLAEHPNSNVSVMRN